jgi:tripartite-type tricarboxylate transporter receptor subunit TctC
MSSGFAMSALAQTWPRRPTRLVVSFPPGGLIDVMFQNLPSVIGQIQGNAVKALAVTMRQRNKALPDVPTLAESALRDFDASAWSGLAAPAGLPAALGASRNKRCKRACATRN